MTGDNRAGMHGSSGASTSHSPGSLLQSFYVGTMEEDGRRVEHLFRNAATLGIPVEVRPSISSRMHTSCTSHLAPKIFSAGL